MPEIDVDTRHGVARVQLSEVAGARAAILLGHGAGGGVGAPDLQAAAAAAAAQNVMVALIEQPYRVAGRRGPPPAPRLDAAWMDVIDHLRRTHLADSALILGGRSMGARVACRTAAAADAVGVLCLAFPLLPPRRAGAVKAPQSRLGELRAVPVPVLVVQGTSDSFGMPPPGRGRKVVKVRGDHNLRASLPAVGAAVSDWLRRLLGDQQR